MKIHIVNEYVILIQSRKHKNILNQDVTSRQEGKKMKVMTPSIIIQIFSTKIETMNLISFD
jgi:hypothetical protein